MSDAENQTFTDLFGDTVYLTPRGKGRPPFEWTQENSHKVSMLLAMGWSNARISSAVIDPRTGKSISVPTLKRYFRAELAARDVARDRMAAKQLLQAAEAASKGNVGAMRFFATLVEKNDAVLAEQTFKAAQQANDPKPAPVGKKEAARRAAQNLTDGNDETWGSDLTPGVYN